MKTTSLLVSMLALALSACDSPAAAQPDPKADDKAKADADEDARLKKRAEDRIAKQKAEEDKQKAIEAAIQKNTAIPEGTKLPKKVADACKQVVEAQRGFMKKFHPGTPDDALTTQLGLIGKQCNETTTVETAMCWKFALDATTEELKGSINEYLKVCMQKYPKK